ncbi:MULTISPECIES: hypothetical protein [unclassified Colwellia]|uniref:hypothetical protein n=1 Tax=unclassified Colwellia TaxID=196834 RepID=UPI0015F53E20|nr:MULTISPECIES: hypothetical protein [unclassified Colwellia]MBA6231615.1 hypothetical protein [Colwellia sp. MB02u-7]MBA6235479.1 hypothetical protein [Colwellia sp. MB02u-11]MBA6258033.1 hypothetical protein [Colwellia sp. MB3u-28]MBA6259727.1 hypothetical protein [Colwellia sp. MB3u-41]MBA6299811.1 hypothetical protein [Colwellia sp. MB3u-22]
MGQRLSFAEVNPLSKDIVELIIDENTLVSIEMVEEFDIYIEQNFKHKIGILMNKINDYKYSFEAKLTLGSLPMIQAVAILNYSNAGISDSDSIEQIRALDNLNTKLFSGLELARDQAINWLVKELT